MYVKRYLKSKVIWGMMALLLAIQVFIGLMLPKNEIAFDDSYMVSVLLTNFIEPRTEESKQAWILDQQYEAQLQKKVAKEKSRAKKSWQTYYRYLIEAMLIGEQAFIECERPDEHFLYKDQIRQLVKQRGVYQVQSKDGEGITGLRYGELYYHDFSYIRYVLWLEEHHLTPLPYHSMSLATACLQLTRVFSDYWLIGLIVSLIMIGKAKKEHEDSLFFVLPRQKGKWLRRTIGTHYLLGLMILVIPMVVAGLCFGIGQFQYPVAVNLGWQVIPADLESQSEGFVLGLSYMSYPLMKTYVTYLPVWVVGLLSLACTSLMMLAASQVTLLFNRIIRETLLAGLLSGLVCWGLLTIFKPTQALLAEVSQSYVQIVCLLVGLNLLLWSVNYLVHQYKSGI